MALVDLELEFAQVAFDAIELVADGVDVLGHRQALVARSAAPARAAITRFRIGRDLNMDEGSVSWISRPPCGVVGRWRCGRHIPLALMSLAKLGQSGEQGAFGPLGIPRNVPVSGAGAAEDDGVAAAILLPAVPRLDLGADRRSLP
jgi:hypothetical protein